MTSSHRFACSHHAQKPSESRLAPARNPQNSTSTHQLACSAHRPRPIDSRILPARSTHCDRFARILRVFRAPSVTDRIAKNLRENTAVHRSRLFCRCTVTSVLVCRSSNLRSESVREHPRSAATCPIALARMQHQCFLGVPKRKKENLLVRTKINLTPLPISDA